MKIDSFGQIEITENELIQLLYTGNTTHVEKIYLDNLTKIEQYNLANEKNYTLLPNLKSVSANNTPLAEFDKNNQEIWFMPESYQSFDIFEFVINKCQNDVEKERVLQEIELFNKHNMINVLKYLKFLVDTMKENNIVWGVGRGSSVASYCLYLLGVHKVNSIKYNLNINEFLK